MPLAHPWGVEDRGCRDNSAHLGTTADPIAVRKGPIESAEDVQGLCHGIDSMPILFLQGPCGPQ